MSTPRQPGTGFLILHLKNPCSWSGWMLPCYSDLPSARCCWSPAYWLHGLATPLLGVRGGRGGLCGALVQMLLLWVESCFHAAYCKPTIAEGERQPQLYNCWCNWFSAVQCCRYIVCLSGCYYQAISLVAMRWRCEVVPSHGATMCIPRLDPLQPCKGCPEKDISLLRQAAFRTRQAL